MSQLKFSVVWVLLLFVIACKPTENPYTGELEALYQETLALYCERQELQEGMETMWDDVSQALEENLPPTLTPQERSNMIKLKNADLIRMFEVYPELDNSIHTLVDSAEVNDQRIATQLTNLQERLLDNEQKVMASLGKIREDYPEDYNSWKAKFNTAKENPCDTKM